MLTCYEARSAAPVDISGIDMPGVFRGMNAHLLRNFMTGEPAREGVVRAYVEALKIGSFPESGHYF
ncbi:MAG: hypothetical protein HGA71_14705 [Azonexaceae bacterium]|nr:hypothetical protein [Azonexaceae bacterium]